MFSSRFFLLLLMVGVFLVINFITRFILMLESVNEVDMAFLQFVKIYGIGIFYDFVTAIYYFLPFTLYLIVVPSKLFTTKYHQKFMFLLMFITSYFIIFNGVSEWFFWEEFGKRFNFIAVDYLVYTHEVIHNILESYPVPLLLATIFIINIFLWFFILKYTSYITKSFQEDGSFQKRMKTGTLFLLLPILFFNLLDKQPLSKVSENIYNNELAKNGLYSLFSAFRHNTLAYNLYYKTEPIDYVMKNLFHLEGMDNKHEKLVIAQESEHHYNVMLIMVESLSAEYMGIFGDERKLTPYLDNLAKEALFFDNFYATGTRTVRGMEAVTLSLPPTSGRSIVKRPDCHNMDSSGFIFLEKGYENKFIYGGYGYFDNMNDFFSHNGFEVVDRMSFTKEETTFGNVWGVCDEDLFNKALQEADKTYAKSKPFFNFMMTTSNHRPYTYPNGKIDIPSHSGRAGGVKYTDYAIEQFIEKAKEKPWFDNTIFVIAADHNGGSAGKNTLPVWRYKIPCILYAPNIIPSQRVNKVASQVDLMPTLMGILKFNYKSFFYGNNILEDNFKERAFIGNYQKLGFLRDNNLTVLLPNKTVKEFRIKKQTLRGVEYEIMKPNFQDENDTITYYQSASYFYDNKLNRWKSNN